MEYIFIGVNYNSSCLIEPWVESIKSKASNYQIIIVDNFSNNNERNKVKSLSEKLSFKLIESENTGYSKAMNQALILYKNRIKNAVIFCGNLDVTFSNIPKNLKDGNFVYIPIVKELKRKNRNPFLTNLQKKVIPIYSLSAKRKSVALYYLAIIVNKFIGFIPSKIWAIHGSLFCFNSSLINDTDDLPFNNDSFLYGEEIEFASYIESKNFILVKSKITINHLANATTSLIIKNQRQFINLWAPSFINYIKRWNL
jgi:hypothetical protein